MGYFLSFPKPPSSEGPRKSNILTKSAPPALHSSNVVLIEEAKGSWKTWLTQWPWVASNALVASHHLEKTSQVSYHGPEHVSSAQPAFTLSF